MVYSLVAKFLGQSRGIIQLFLVYFFFLLSSRVQLLLRFNRFHIFVCVFPLLRRSTRFEFFGLFAFPMLFTLHFSFGLRRTIFLFINIVLLLCVSFSTRHKHYYSRSMCVSVCVQSASCVCFMFVLENI